MVSWRQGCPNILGYSGLVISVRLDYQPLFGKGARAPPPRKRRKSSLPMRTREGACYRFTSPQLVPRCQPYNLKCSAPIITQNAWITFRVVRNCDSDKIKCPEGYSHPYFYFGIQQIKCTHDCYFHWPAICSDVPTSRLTFKSRARVAKRVQALADHCVTHGVSSRAWHEVFILTDSLRHENFIYRRYFHQSI